MRAHALDALQTAWRRSAPDAADPDLPDMDNNIGRILYAQGLRTDRHETFAAAAAAYRKAARCGRPSRPATAIAQRNLGYALYRGRAFGG